MDAKPRSEQVFWNILMPVPGHQNRCGLPINFAKGFGVNLIKARD